MTEFPDFVFLHSVSALVIVLDGHGRIEWWNRACEVLTGHSLELVRGLLFWDILLITEPEEVETVKLEFSRLCAGNAPSRFENRWRMKTGAERWIAWSNSVILEPNGPVQHVVVTGVHITLRKETEQAVALSKPHLAASWRCRPMASSSSMGHSESPSSTKERRALSATRKQRCSESISTFSFPSDFARCIASTSTISSRAT